MKKLLIVAVSLLIIVCTACTLVSCNKDEGEESAILARQFSEKKELIKLVKGYGEMYKLSNKLGSRLVGRGALENNLVSEKAVSVPTTAAGDASNGATDDYTGTNVQIEGIDEGDIVKVDGEYIYYLAEGGLSITKAKDGQLERTSFFKFESFCPYEMYVSGNKLVVLGGKFGDTSLSHNEGSYVSPSYYYNYCPKTMVCVFDISDKTSLKVERQIILEGNFNTSRLIDGTLYYVVNYHFYEGEEEKYLPKVSDSLVEGGKEREIPLSDVYYFDGIPNYNYVLAGKIKIDNPSEGILKGYLGAGNDIYVSENYLYVTSSDYTEKYVRSLFSTTYNDEGRTYTRILKMKLGDLTFEAGNRVEGTIKDRYSLDEYEGNLRIATTSSFLEGENYRTYSCVFVLSPALNTIGKITEIAEGETIYSVRFNKKEGVIVTFKQIDPLFKLDLSDPENPTISKGLKKEGVSYYLHYVEGTDFIIGLGRSAALPEFNGSTGIEVALFDNSGEEAKIINIINIPAYDTEAMYNPKSILYDKERDIFAFAAIEYKYNKNLGYTTSYTQGLYVFGFSTGKLILRAKLGNVEKMYQYSDDYNKSYEQYYDYVTRGARIGDYIYTISPSTIAAYSINDFTKTDVEIIAKYSYIDQKLVVTTD